MKRMSSGVAQGADLLADVLAQVFLQLFVGLAAFQRDEAADAFALDFVGAGRRRRLRRPLGWLTRALSISMVLRRWPATLSTSSTRPMTQK